MGGRYGGAMECDDYQRAALRTARPTDAPDEFMHLVLGLVGEAGEVAEKVKKLGTARIRQIAGRAGGGTKASG
jgi:NTP pyrophosphatase (non-canonical NTP hydrolase)